MRTHFVVSGVVLLWAFSSVWADEPEPKGGPPEFKHLKYRLVGPAAGGRVSRACGIPGDPLTYYAATSAGGVWKSSDGGVNWKPIFDDQPISSIGSIAVATSDSNVIYVGSGEANIRGNVAAGNGIYKSTDAGKTWQHVWKQEGQIGTIIVHPTNPDVAFAAVLGHAFGPNPERGVYRTTDGGKTWKQVLAKDPDTGASDVCFDPSNPRILFAGLWQARRRPWEMTSGGPGGGLYVSRDGGDTWKQLGGHGLDKEKLKGLPEGIYGKVGVAVAPSDGRRVYALIEADKGGLYVSTNGGESWERANGGRYLTQRAWYYSTLTVDPVNPDVVWVPQVPLLKSIDGGKTFKRVKGPHHGDHHDIWIDPKDPKRIIDSNDGGVDISINGGESWYAPPLPISQFYHVSADNRVPYYVMGNMQDLGTAAGPSNSLATSGILLGDWFPVGGGETGFSVPDPTDPNIVFAGEYGGYISRFDFRTRQARNVSIYPTNPSGHGAGDLRYRFQWTAPILISPHDPKVVYHAANVLFQSTDGGMSWTPISGDLTRNDKTKQQWSGGPITGDNTTAEYYCTIFAIAESPKQKGILWAGSDDGLVHVSKDGGKSWTNVTPPSSSWREWGTVSCIEASPFDAGTAYVVLDAHRLDDMKPYLFKTTDFGATWESCAGDLPPDVYLHVIREDPKRQGMLYAGTERGVSFSIDGGKLWRELKLNLPTVAVHDLVVKNDDLVVGTNGRSIWIFDDLTPIREYSSTTTAQQAHLFPSQPAKRWRYHSTVDRPLARQAGANPPPGAVVTYYLREKPKDPLRLEVLDDKGQVIRTISSKPEEPETLPGDPDGRDDDPKKRALPANVGVNRFSWDLCYAGPTRIQKAKSDMGDARTGPMVLPGAYTLRLNIDGKSLTTKVEVQQDPRVIVPLAQMQAQEKFALTVRDDISRLSNIVHRLRAVRTQLTARNELLKDDSRLEPLVKASTEVIAKLDGLEAKLHNPKAEVTYDILAQKGGAKLYSKLILLFEFARDSDGAPTQGMNEVYDELNRELNELEAEWKAVVSGELAKLNETAKSLDIPAVIVPATPSSEKLR
jgi:photosystem II stability/assembly factor-like uncharacterized protein